MSSVMESAKKISGMGAIVHKMGVAFRVWAPHADSVAVIGTFNNWQKNTHEMESEENGMWYLNTSDAAAGDHYKYLIRNGEQELFRVDPQAREVTNSVGDGVISNPDFDWENDDFEIAPLNELVIYEMHIGTFGRGKNPDAPATFDEAIKRLGHLQKIGINCVELMPVCEFAGDFSWGYNPAHLFAVESAYGGPEGFRRFVREAHRRGIGVILDVVYNHLGPSDLSVWQFDGWSENNLGGIYFYNDWRSETPWGSTRPDFGRGEVRQFLYDNAMMWLKEYHVDGLRYDMTLYMRTVDGTGTGTDLPDGWSLAQWINEAIRKEFPGKILIAEDLQNNEWMTREAEQGGACFHTQWDAQFVHPVRSVLTNPTDEGRSVEAIKRALTAQYNGDPFQRVVYTESHDEVANGKARIPSEIMPDDPANWYAEKRAALGASLVLTAPGVPMLFQGQEFLEDGWFQDTVPLDWDKNAEFRGVVRLFRDLIRLRLNVEGDTKALSGSHIRFLYESTTEKVLAFQRTFESEEEGGVVVIMNFTQEGRTIPFHFPMKGLWKLRLNSDARIYREHYGDTPASDMNCKSPDEPAELQIGPYAALIYSFAKENSTEEVEQ